MEILTYQMLFEFGKAIDIYGHLIPQPKFAFKLKVARTSISIIGKKENTVRISLNGVDFLKFNAAELVKQIKESDSHMYELNFVGRAQINEWNNKMTPQIMIDEIDVEPIHLDDLF